MVKVEVMAWQWWESAAGGPFEWHGDKRGVDAVAYNDGNGMAMVVDECRSLSAVGMEMVTVEVMAW